MSEEKEKEECPECSLAVGLGMSLNLCKTAKDVDLDCDEIHDKLMKGEMESEEAFGKIKKAFEGKPEYKKLELIDMLIHGASEKEIAEKIGKSKI